LSPTLVLVPAGSLAIRFASGPVEDSTNKAHDKPRDPAAIGAIDLMDQLVEGIVIVWCHAEKLRGPKVDPIDRPIPEWLDV
jgi:hypothetical protein